MTTKLVRFYGWNASKHSNVDHYWLQGPDDDAAVSRCGGMREHPRNVSVIFANKVGRRCMLCEKRLAKGVDKAG